MRIAEHHISSYLSHSQEVCGLQWSPDGNLLASGGNDNVLNIWDAASMHGGTQHPTVTPLHSLCEHVAAVKVNILLIVRRILYYYSIFNRTMNFVMMLTNECGFYWHLVDDISRWFTNDLCWQLAHDNFRWFTNECIHRWLWFVLTFLGGLLIIVSY